MLELFALLSAAAGYLIRLFLIEERSSHYGPFPAQDATVKRIHRDREGDIAYIYEQPVTLLERIRRLTPLNPYMIDESTQEWHINGLKSEVWECPKCLSPWVAVAITVPVLLLTGKWKQIPLMTLAVTGGGYFMFVLTDYLMYSEEIVEAISQDLPFDDQGTL